MEIFCMILLKVTRKLLRDLRPNIIVVRFLIGEA